MTKHIIEYLIRQGAISQQNAVVYLYGLQSLLQAAACYGTMLFLAAVTHHVIDTILFLLIFLPIRKYAGGYHSSTPLRCFLLSIAAWAVIMTLCQFTYSPVLCVVTALSVAILWRFAPLPHHNNPLSEKRMREVTHIIRVILAVVVLCFIILMLLRQMHFTALICYTLLTCALSLLVQKYSQNAKQAAD